MSTRNCAQPSWYQNVPIERILECPKGHYMWMPLGYMMPFPLFFFSFRAFFLVEQLNRYSRDLIFFFDAKRVQEVVTVLTSSFDFMINLIIFILDLEPTSGLLIKQFIILPRRSWSERMNIREGTQFVIMPWRSSSERISARTNDFVILPWRSLSKRISIKTNSSLRCHGDCWARECRCYNEDDSRRLTTLSAT
jgi:hypothetical protein